MSTLEETIDKEKDALGFCPCDILRCRNHRDSLRTIMLALLDEVEGSALRCSAIEVNEFFLDDEIQPLRMRVRRAF